MKRVFANIGFSVAVTLIVLNFMNIKAALAALIASSVAFVVCCAASKAVKRQGNYVLLARSFIFLFAFCFFLLWQLSAANKIVRQNGVC